MSGQQVGWLVLDLDVRIDAAVLHGPLAVERVNGVLGDRHVAAVHHRPVAADAAHATPRPGADDRAESVLLEQVREDVAVGRRPVVHQRDHGSVQHRFRLGLDAALAVGSQRNQHPAQPLQCERCDEAAAVPAVVEDHGLFAELRIELAHELLDTELFHVAHVDVAHPSTGQLVDERPVVLDPGRLAQRKLLADRLDREVATRAFRARRHDQIDRRVGIRQLQQGVRIGRRAQLRAVDREHVVAGLHVETGLGDRTAVVVARVVAGVDPGEAIAPRRRVERPVDAQ